MFANPLKTLVLSVLLLLISGFSAAAEQDTYTNPVLVDILPILEPGTNRVIGTMGIGDPAVIFHKGKYYLYPTGDQNSYVVYISPDLVHWEKGPVVFLTAEPGTWAPDVFYNTKDKTFYLYYTVNRRIGVAVSDGPEGPFIDRGTLIKGAIDAHMFMDDDSKYYLYYVKYPDFKIYVQPMKDPYKKKGRPIQLIFPSDKWEKTPASLTEAPWMIKHDGTYYLLYSAGGADTQYYATGYAVSKDPTGPFIKHSGNPIVKKGGGVFGPGHVSVTRDHGGNLWMVYHQQNDKTKGWRRIICIDPLRFDDKGILHITATRAVPRPAPVVRPEKPGPDKTS